MEKKCCNIEKNIKLLKEAIFEKHKTKVIFSHNVDSCFNIKSNIIFINENHDIETKLMYLIHEIGHVIYNETYDNITNEQYIDELFEEIFAWKEGIIFAKKYCLNININDEIIEKSMLTYI